MRFPAAVFGLLLATATTLVAQGTAVVSGVVRDEAGGPVREVLVVVDPDSLSLRTRTDADGRYRITVPTGRYEVRIVRIGFRPQSHTIDVTGPVTQLNVTLQSVAIPLDTVAVRATRPGLFGLVVTRGIMLTPHEPRPLRGARVEVVNQPHNVSSGPDGRFSMPQLGPGAHAVLVSLDRFVSRMIPVSLAPDGGVEITVVLDSLYAEYQRVDEEQVRGITWRQRRATNPAAFVPLHEIDLEARDLREGLRYSDALLSRGLRILSGCIYLNGKPRTELALQDIDPKEVEAIEVYPPNTLQDNDRLPPFPIGTPCGRLWGPPTIAMTPGRGVPRRTPVRTRGNTDTAIVIWTRGRR